MLIDTSTGCTGCHICPENSHHMWISFAWALRVEQSIHIEKTWQIFGIEIENIYNNLLAEFYFTH